MAEPLRVVVTAVDLSLQALVELVLKLAAALFLSVLLMAFGLGLFGLMVFLAWRTLVVYFG